MPDFLPERMQDLLHGRQSEVRADEGAPDRAMTHCFVNNGYRIVLDVNSNSVHVMDELAFALVPIAEKLYDEHALSRDSLAARASLQGDLSYSQEDILSAATDIVSLVEAGQLFAEDSYEEALDTQRPVLDTGIVKALCLHMAHGCNLACEYCFAGRGQYRGPAGLMSEEVGMTALDFLVRMSGSRRNLEVDFFGGEPTLDWAVIKKLVSYGRELEQRYDKRFRFTLTTNGVLLDDEMTEYANAELSNVVLSLDGRKSVHDRMRPMADGSGSCYDAIVPKFLRFARMRGNRDFYVRGTYTHYNLDFCEDVLAMADLGFPVISMEPVVAPKTAPYAITEEDVPKLCAEYDRLAGAMLDREREGRGFQFFHFMIDLKGGPCALKRITGCGAGTQYLAVTPWGDLYPCHQFVGETSFLMGNVYDGVTNKALADSFAHSSVYSKPACRECFARFYCSGGCHANAYHFSGDINGDYEIGCKLERKRVECAIMMEAARAVSSE